MSNIEEMNSDEKLNEPPVISKKEQDRLERAAKKEKEHRDKMDKKESDRLDKAAKKEKTRRNAFEKALQNATDRRRLASEKALAAHTVKAQKKVNNSAVSRAALRATLRNRVLAAAKQNVQSLGDENVVIPEKGATEMRFAKYVDAAKKRFYKRTKRYNPSQEAILRVAANAGINAKYVKFTAKHRTSNDVLAAARVRKQKDEAKHGKSAYRDQIMAYAEQTLGLDEKAVRSAICVRKKKKP